MRKEGRIWELVIVSAGLNGPGREVVAVRLGDEVAASACVLIDDLWITSQGSESGS